MAHKRRGREPLINCESCGRTMPRDKSVSINKRVTFTTDLRGSPDDIRISDFRKVHYCISCGKSLRIFERKRTQMMNKYNR